MIATTVQRTAGLLGAIALICVALPAPVVQGAGPGRQTPPSGVLVLKHKGLPRGVVATLVLRAHGKQRVVRPGRNRLPAGRYRITARPVVSGAVTYRAVKPRRSIRVTARDRTRLVVAYRADRPDGQVRPGPTGSDGAPRYDVGSPVVTDVWVDPAAGDDARSGASRGQALRTVSEAWRRIPADRTLSGGYRLQLVAGDYPASGLPNYWENRRGSASAPVILNAVDGAGTVTFAQDINAFRLSHFYVLGVDVIVEGDVFHCERCSYVLLRNMRMDGRGAAHETVKVNQSDHIYIEDSEVANAYENPVDFVAVQHGHVVGNSIHGAGDWCAYFKGGSAYLLFSDNEVYDCGTGGFTAGQGTGFEFMVAPWLHYETYGVTVVNNVIHDTEGAGLGVNGSFGTVMAYNTLYRTGRRSHLVEFVHGARSCDGDTAACRAHRDAGGWGPASGDAGQVIPNKHLRFVNNVIVNPAGYQSRWQHFTVAGPAVPGAGTNIPSLSRADDDLVIAGNVIVNGDRMMPLGFDTDACGDTNPVCNASRVQATNLINDIPGALTNPDTGDYRPAAGSALSGVAAVAVPGVPWTAAPPVPAIPAGPGFTVPRTHDGRERTGWGRPGAY